jgi:hypothetical protein
VTDIVLGAIIGGVIALVGTAIGYVIQGQYALKNKREDNLIRMQELSTRIQHEKNSELTSRIIEARARYLDPLSDQLGELNTSTNDFRDKLLIVTVPYLREKNKILEASEISEISRKCEIQVEEAEKQKFVKQLKTVESVLSTIDTRRTRIYESALKVTDLKLGQLLRDLLAKVFSLGETYFKMNVSLLEENTTGHDFRYDCEPILKLVGDVNVRIAKSNHRIESLRAGADAGDE